MTKDARESDLYWQSEDSVVEFERSTQPDLTQIGREFAQLQETMIQQKKSYAAAVGAKAKNRAKNRYDDILPYDRTRVILHSNAEDSDYINASFVEDLSGQCCYIAAQGPTDDSVVDFLRMIWEYEITVIICPANDVEAGRMKFCRYWPNRGKSLQFGLYRIIQDECHPRSFHGEDYELCPLVIRRGGSERHVILYHFFYWFDHGIPDRAEPILDFLQHLDRDRPVSPRVPILVHCSAGCGRTGTIIAIDLLHLWLTNQRSSSRMISVFQIASHIRQFRMVLIQTLKQYFFVYKVFVLMMKNSRNRHFKLDVNKTTPLSSSTKAEVSPPSTLKSSRSRSSDILNMILSQPVMDYDSASDSDTSSSSQSSAFMWVQTHQLREPLPMKTEDYQSDSARSKKKERISICVNTPDFYPSASYRHHPR